MQNLCSVPDLSPTLILTGKKTLDLEIFSRIGNTKKKVKWYPNTIVKTSFLLIYLPIWFIYSWNVKHLVTCFYYNRSEMYSGPLKTSTIKLFTEIVSNFNIKLLTILAKRLIFCAWLCPECASADRCNIVPKFKRIYLPNRR